MSKRLLAATATALVIALAISLPTGAEEQPVPPAPAAQGEPGAAQITPDPEPAANTTGGVTATGREVLPDDTTEATVDAETLEGAAAPAAGSPTTDTKNVVPAEMVEALRQMALEQQRKAATTVPPPSDDDIAAEKRALAAHRDSLFGRVEARS